METPITRAEHEEFAKRIEEENHRQNRRIEILDENEEYAVVSKETYNGLVRYDRIVKNADKVSEQDILY